MLLPNIGFSLCVLRGLCERYIVFPARNETLFFATDPPHGIGRQAHAEGRRLFIPSIRLTKRYHRSTRKSFSAHRA
jgi:hypothetical protein